MLAAVSGFVGVVVGAVLSGGFGLLTNRWRIAAEARAAARLTAAELARQIRRLDQSIAVAVVDSGQAVPIARDARWDDHLQVLAIALSYDDWLLLERADAVLKVATAAAEGTPGRTAIERQCRQLTAALSALNEVARRGPPSWHRPTRASRALRDV